jgi:hypothetical protein
MNFEGATYGQPPLVSSRGRIAAQVPVGPLRIRQLTDPPRRRGHSPPCSATSRRGRIFDPPDGRGE